MNFKRSSEASGWDGVNRGESSKKILPWDLTSSMLAFTCSMLIPFSESDPFAYSSLHLLGSIQVVIPVPSPIKDN